MKHLSERIQTTVQEDDRPMWFERRADRVRRMGEHAGRQRQPQRAAMLDLLAFAYFLRWRSLIAAHLDEEVSDELAARALHTVACARLVTLHPSASA